MVEKSAGLDIRYVKIDDPITIRKNVLNAAVDATTLLKRWEGYKRIKETKLICINKLRLLMRRIHNEELAFRRSFPSVYEDEKILKKHFSYTKTIIKKDNLVKTKEMTELDKEIEQIKLKISKLNI